MTKTIKKTLEVSKEMNEKILRIWGSASIPPILTVELGEDVSVVVKGSVLRIEEKDNQDGTKDIIYVVKIITAEIQK